MSGQPPLALVDRSVLEHPAWRTKLANYGRRFNSPIVSQGR
jgi:hypothetical protein